MGAISEKKFFLLTVAAVVFLLAKLSSVSAAIDVI